ncbi:Uncharacterized Fe-S protein [Phocoenobacter uteri]|uniref:Uncharacterized Fe-S protein n=1 Tax=Phocoenobacter uteri TaxID=146806 RepID=A0A379CC22_9PAST|nr:MOSC N-terminal beta barrel domain-containing protein [Phocoenobacter uteri]MDG6881777.1 hypothetical protein [Phocoenobacter uteri]SUB59814.1 Uncharacterized Fe-S protein [Phocoenobacter uteri]
MVITQLWIYPIKSCQGIAVSSVDLLASGFKHDREMMIVDEKTGMFVTQRSDKILSHIKVVLPDENNVSIIFNQRAITFEKQYVNTVNSKVWKRELKAFDQGDTVAQFLSEIIGRNVRLLAIRPMDTLNSAKNILFQDSQAVHLVTEFSLHHCQQHLADYHIDVQRFRPNIVIGSRISEDAFPPFIEDNWQKIQTEHTELIIKKRCERCTIPSINPQTLAKEKAIDHYLQQHRTFKKKPVFGISGYASKLGTLHVGDPIQYT